MNKMSEHEHGHKDDSEDGGHNSKSHLLIMALSCLIPIIILLIVVNANIEASYLPFLLILLCPLMMLLMHLPRTLGRKKRTEKTQNETHHQVKIGSREQRLGEVGTSQTTSPA